MFGEMLPHGGWFCVAKKTPKGFHHVWFRDAEEAEKYALSEDKKGSEVYLAQSSFKTKENRRQENVLAVRSFWLDIDCGPGKPYDTQGDGALALKSFCNRTNLPLPSVTNSGNGLYAHWVLESDIDPTSWKETACLLKSVCTACGFASDDSRTSDSASVLRPMGTRNKKDPANPKLVKVVSEAKDIPFLGFHDILSTYALKNNVTPVSPAPQKQSLNLDFAVVYDGPPSKAEKVRASCQHIAYIARSQEEIPEPLWYAMVSVVRLCVDGPAFVHAWSKEYSRYDPVETDKKIAQLEARNIGPTTCERFKALNALGCLGCPHVVTSPIILGKEYEVTAPTIEAEELPDFPKGFSLTKHGLLFEGLPTDDGEVKKPIVFYDQELYVTDMAWDESVGYETATVKHFLRNEGWKEFKLRSSLTNDTKSFQMALADNHVKLVGVNNKKVMLMYIESFLSKIQRSKKMAQLVCQMGWKEDGRFVLGRTVILPDGSSEPIDLAKSVPQAVEAFHTAGELEPWVAATEVLGKPGMMPLAFTLCAGAFGAPLMKFTGYPGAMVSLVGASGTGKTLIGTFMLSAYGKPDRLMMLKDDTRNSLIGRLGAYGSLPLYIDEITNTTPEELSELTYRVTQGRDKTRLTRNAVERTVNNHWQTLAVVSSNASIIDKLSGHKQDASPELNRVLEFTITENVEFARDAATALYRTITENYGHAGVEYIKYLVAHRGTHQAKIDQIVKVIDEKTKATNDERYWSAIAGATLYGASVAKNLGLIRFDVSQLLNWVVGTIIDMRGNKSGAVNTAMDSLGQMLDDLSQNRLVIGKTDACAVEPRGALHIRIEANNDLMYISRAKVMDWCLRNHASYTTMRNGLEELRVLLDPSKRKVLGGRTEYAGAQQPCWVIDLKSPLMGKYQVQVVREMNLAREKEG